MIFIMGNASLHRGLVAYRSEGYDESALRNDFFAPFWPALGWDVAGLSAIPTRSAD